jgi:hypothetical protein
MDRLRQQERQLFSAHGSERKLNLAFGAAIDHVDVYAESAGGILHIAHLARDCWEFWIYKYLNIGGSGHELPNKVQTFRSHLKTHDSRANEIAARTIETGDKPGVDGIADRGPARLLLAQTLLKRPAVEHLCSATILCSRALVFGRRISKLSRAAIS